jgi:pyrroline-5-carboxylate reductase
MPNAAAEIGRSYTPWIASENVSTADKAFVQAIFETCGVAAEQRNEADINYLTGLTGSGPAFPALFADALLSHALSRGLEAQTARQAVHGVITGAFHLFAATGRSPGEVVADFLSYRGTTAAGLQAMTDAGFITAVSVGLDAAEDAAARIGEV